MAKSRANDAIRINALWVEGYGDPYCTRDRILISKRLSFVDYDGEGGIDRLLADLQPTDWVPTRIRSEGVWDYGEDDYFLEGWRSPTEEEQAKIDTAWAKEDEKRRKIRAKAKERKQKADAAREAAERKAYEKLAAKYG